MSIIKHHARQTSRSLNWWTRVIIGPTAVRLALAFAFLALALSVYAFSSLQQRADQNTARITQENQDRTAAIARNVRAREDDCNKINQLRAGLRGIVISTFKSSLPILRKTAPQIITPEYLRLAERTYRQELALFARQDCTAYAREALPR